MQVCMCAAILLWAVLCSCNGYESLSLKEEQVGHLSLPMPQIGEGQSVVGIIGPAHYAPLTHIVIVGLWP